jgi:hypothetical protein
MTTRLADDFAMFGLKLVNLVVENISLPPEVEQALDTRTKMGVIGDLNRYTQFQAANAIGDAARNPGGLAGTGAGLAAGMAVGNQMASAMGGAAAASATPPPIPGATAGSYFVVVAGAQKGPFTADQLRDEIASGRVQRSTLGWKQGMPQWTPLENVADLRDIIASIPPPLPKE